MDGHNRELLLEILHDMEDFARLKNLPCPPLYLLGGSACIVGGYIDRATTDFDILDTSFPSHAGRVLRVLGDADFLDIFLTTVALGFEERAVQLEAFKFVNIYVLSVEDIITSKIGRYSEKDIEDIGILIKKSNLSLLEHLIEAILERTNIGVKIKDEFAKNLIRFRGDFNI